ncbi:MAG: deoxyribodipyrimidine photo-lyase, partial [Nitrosarchaeum sp.]|nr:deoxyribodipyrimidine photo-lyase [Nitrosarchaeum sp.]
KATGTRSVHANTDYTPFARRRDEAMAAACKAAGARYTTHHDYLLTHPEAVRTTQGTPYTVFTPFFREAQTYPIQQPQELPEKTSFYTGTLLHAWSGERASILPVENPHLFAKGGRTNALRLLRRLATLTHYAEERDQPHLQATSNLSAHLKFGTISIREAYHAIAEHLGPEHPLLRQLYWRDFFTHIAYHHPRIFGESFRTAYDAIPWGNDENLYGAWKEGQTGYPIVDAGMRELRTTGTMHNRTRMITASFLVKDLHIDWRWGERHFAQHLADYDPSVNNGNWQWAASTGCDSQPYFRIFNPWLQQQKFDPECIYIKRWIPELGNLTPAQIHTLARARPSRLAYPQPIVDHTKQTQEIKAAFAAART